MRKQLRDEQWKRIEAMLPGKTGDPGRTGEEKASRRRRSRHMSIPLTGWEEQYKDAWLRAAELVGERAKQPPGENDGQRR